MKNTKYKTVGTVSKTNKTKCHMVRTVPKSNKKYHTVGTVPKSNKKYHTVGTVPKPNKEYYTVGTVPKSNRQIIERDKIDTLNTHIFNRLFSWLGANISIQSGGVMLVFLGPMLDLKFI